MLLLLLLLCLLLELRHTSKLLMQEGVRPSLLHVELIEPMRRRVHERSWRGVLGGDSQISSVPECVHAFAAGQQSVELGVVGIRIFRLWRERLRLWLLGEW